MEIFVPKYYEINSSVVLSNTEKTKCETICACGNNVFDYNIMKFSERPYPLHDMQIEVEKRNGVLFVNTNKFAATKKPWSFTVYDGEGYWLMHKKDVKLKFFQNGNFLRYPEFFDFIKVSDVPVCEAPLEYDYITAKCKHCGKEILLFDSRYYGYDGVCTHAESPNKQYGSDGKTKVKKPHCEGAGYKVYVTFSSTGKEDLLENESDGVITEENWKDAFDWITIHLECSKCGKKVKVFDLETM